jgi:hypothetical protein
MVAAAIFVLSMNWKYPSTKTDSAQEKLCTKLFTTPGQIFREPPHFPEQNCCFRDLKATYSPRFKKAAGQGE